VNPSALLLVELMQVLAAAVVVVLLGLITGLLATLLMLSVLSLILGKRKK
jgi:hypothetical protein